MNAIKINAEDMRDFPSIFRASIIPSAMVQSITILANMDERKVASKSPPKIKPKANPLKLPPESRIHQRATRFARLVFSIAIPRIIAAKESQGKTVVQGLKTTSGPANPASI